VFVDTARIRQVLLNLLNNSLRFTEQGGVTIRVGREDEHVLVCVQDTGPGIASEDLGRIFEPFQQIKQGQWRRREGAGLGLSISRRFIELHGGRMWAESQLGQGSRFFFTLPSSETTPASLTQGRTTEDRYWQLLEKRAQGERLLLALSPQPDAGDIIAQYAQGFQVMATPDRDQVPEQVSQLLPSALLIDRGERAGERIERMLTELPYDLPVISFPFPGSPTHPGRLPEGVTDYLVKPIQRRQLLDALTELGPEIRRLLVVDDDPAMIRFVARILAGTGDETAPQGCYELATAFSGAEALAALHASRPDAVLLDLMLPDLDGWQVLEQLRKEHIPVVLVTAYDYPQTRQDGLREVMQITMRRPLSRQELGEVLQHLLSAIRPSYPTTAGEPAPLKGPAG
jgi:CheY-like chemotaxis protein